MDAIEGLERIDKRLYAIVMESHKGVSQMYLANSELNHARMEGAAKYFEWCAKRVRDLAEAMKQARENTKATEPAADLERVAG